MKDIKRLVGKQVQLITIKNSYRYGELPTTIGTILAIYKEGQKIHPKTVSLCIGLTEDDWQYKELEQLENKKRTVVQTIEREIIIFDVWPNEVQAMVLV